jgi:hypothetical protein
MGRFDWPLTKKKLKLERLPQNGNLNVRMASLLGTPLGNIMKEPIGNTIGERSEGTHWEPEEHH